LAREMVERRRGRGRVGLGEWDRFRFWRSVRETSKYGNRSHEEIAIHARARIDLGTHLMCDSTCRPCANNSVLTVSARPTQPHPPTPSRRFSFSLTNKHFPPKSRLPGALPQSPAAPFHLASLRLRIGWVRDPRSITVRLGSPRLCMCLPRMAAHPIPPPGATVQDRVGRARRM
jgi:hypothetical protein